MWLTRWHVGVCHPPIKSQPLKNVICSSNHTGQDSNSDTRMCYIWHRFFSSSCQQVHALVASSQRTRGGAYDHTCAGGCGSALTALRYRTPPLLTRSPRSHGESRWKSRLWMGLQRPAAHVEEERDSWWDFTLDASSLFMYIKSFGSNSSLVLKR